MVDVPDDLRAFLTVPENHRLQLAPDGEVEQLELLPSDQLAEGSFTFHGTSSQDERMYEVRGVGLVKWCPNYQPKGIMVWFPSLGLYGTWDCDHHAIMVFPHVGWSDIMRRPELYFNGAWYPDRVTHRYLRPDDGVLHDARPDPLEDHPRLPGF